MISFSPEVSASSSRSYPSRSFPTCGTRPVPTAQAPDYAYLLRVIDFLHRERKNQKLSRDSITRRFHLRKNLISRAEREGLVPTVNEFKVWAAALGLTWDQVWSLSLPSGVNS